MAETLDQFIDRVWRSASEDVYEAGDIGHLISLVLSQKQDIERLTDALETAGKHIQHLERVSQLEPFTNLVQYAEESAVA